MFRFTLKECVTSMVQFKIIMLKRAFECLPNCLNAISIGLDEIMFSSLSGNIYPTSIIVYYAIMNCCSTDAGLLTEKEERKNVKI